MMELHDYQEYAVKFIEEHPISALLLDMGLGKTITTLTAINNLAATVLSVLKPAFETIAAVIIVFVQWIAAAIKAVGSFFGLFSGRGVKAVNSVSANMGQIKDNTSDVTSGVGDLEDAFKKAEE